MQERGKDEEKTAPLVPEGYPNLRDFVGMHTRLKMTCHNIAHTDTDKKTKRIHRDFITHAQC